MAFLLMVLLPNFSRFFPWIQISWKKTIIKLDFKISRNNLSKQLGYRNFWHFQKLIFLYVPLKSFFATMESIIITHLIWFSNITGYIGKFTIPLLFDTCTYILEIQIYISRVGRGIPACKNRTQNLFRSPRLRPTPWHSRRVGEWTRLPWGANLRRLGCKSNLS